MKNKYFKAISVFLIFALLISTVSPSIAIAKDHNCNSSGYHKLLKNKQVNKPDYKSNLKGFENSNKFIKVNGKYRNINSLTLDNFKSIEDIPEELLEPNFYSEDEIITLPESYLDPNNPDAIDVIYVTNNKEEGKIQTYGAVAAAGVYFIPGIGKVAIAVTGAIIIGGVTIKAGSWLYNKISTYFAKKEAEEAAEKIPKKLKSKSDDMKVDLGKFKNKYGKTAKQTTSNPPFTNGNWYLEKDEAGHLGYNGEKKVWKLWKKGEKKRTASLDKHGNVISK